MKNRLKKNTAAEEAYVRDLKRSGPLESTERGTAQILSEQEYPEPIQRLVARRRDTLQLHLSARARKKLENVGRAQGLSGDALAKKWVEQRLREVG